MRWRPTRGIGSATAPPRATVGPLTAMVALMAVAGCADQDAAGGVVLSRLVGSAADRLATADGVATAKWVSRQPITDPPREQAVLDAAAAGSASRSLDPADAVAVLRDQIEAHKTVQEGLFAQWRADPTHAPTLGPNLTLVRPVLDQMTGQLLDGLRDAAPQRSELRCVAQLRRAVDEVGAARHLDELHRRALGQAVRSVCR